MAFTDWAALRTTVAQARPLLLADASDYRGRCRGEQLPTPMPVPPPPSAR